MYAAGLTSRTIAYLLSYLKSDHTDPDQYTLARVRPHRRHRPVRGRLAILRLLQLSG